MNQRNIPRLQSSKRLLYSEAMQECRLDILQGNSLLLELESSELVELLGLWKRTWGDVGGLF